MINNTKFSALANGERFSFRNVFIGRKWIKTGEYSFIPDTQPDEDTKRIRREELLTSDFRVTKYRTPEGTTRLRLDEYLDGIGSSPF